MTIAQIKSARRRMAHDPRWRKKNAKTRLARQVILASRKKNAKV